MEQVRMSPQVLLDEGLKRATERCRREMPSAVEWRLDQAIGNARTLLSSQEAMDVWTEWHQRGALLFLEVVAIGAYARAINKEPPLTISDLPAFAEWLKKIVNSWFHE